MAMEHEKGFEFIKKAYEVDNDEKLWDLYLINFRNMNKDNFISFSEYKENISKETIEENLSKHEIEEKVKKIINITIVREGEN